MPTKHFFTKNHERVGKKSGKPREKKEKKQQLSSNDAGRSIESPNINRSITDSTSKKAFWTNWTLKKSLFLLFFLLASGIAIWELGMLFLASKKLFSLIVVRVELSQKMQLWDNIAQKYPTYRDAYFQEALLAYQLGDSKKEAMYLQKVLVLDPNFEPAKNLEKISE